METAWTRRPLQSVEYVITNYARLAWREIRPTGILVAVMGPDGVGKSTVITGLIESPRTRILAPAQIISLAARKRFL